MANGRNRTRKGVDTGRDSGGFVALPWSVLDCPAYARLSHPARSLLMEIARQFVRDNNGKLLASGAYLASRGWKSNDVVTRAKNELLEAGFIFQTVVGHRPNKASWFAMTWQRLDKLPGYDPGAEQMFQRGAYQQIQPPKNAPLKPSGGVGRRSIAPSGGVGDALTTPSGGAIRGISALLSTPSGGDLLEKPSLYAFPGCPSLAAATPSIGLHHAGGDFILHQPHLDQLRDMSAWSGLLH